MLGFNSEAIRVDDLKQKTKTFQHFYTVYTAIPYPAFVFFTEG